MEKLRVFFSGVGGQGTLTATNLVGLMASKKGIPVVCGEIHGMAQRGGSVESYALLGGYRSPKIDIGEADVLLGFEPLEALRSLHYLKKEGKIFVSTDPIYPPEVNLGIKDYPEISRIEACCRECTQDVYMIPAIELAKKTKVVQTANTIILACFCMLGTSLFSLDDLKDSIVEFMPKKVQDVNLMAVEVAENFVDQRGWR